MSRKRPVDARSEFRLKRALQKPLTIPPDLFKRDADPADTVASASDLAFFVNKSIDKKADNYERFLKKLENRAVKTDIIVEQLGIDHVSFRKRMSQRTSKFFRNQVEKPVFAKPTISDERIYHYAVAAVLKLLDPSPNRSVLEASRARWHRWLRSDFPSFQADSMMLRGRLLSVQSQSSDEDELDNRSQTSADEDAAAALDNTSSQSVHETQPHNADSSEHAQNGNAPHDADAQTAASNVHVVLGHKEAHEEVEMTAPPSARTPPRSTSQQPIRNTTPPGRQPTLDSQTTSGSAMELTLPPPPTPTSPGQGGGVFTARRIAQDVADIATTTGAAAGNIQRALTKSLKEWELLSALQKVYQLDPEIHKQVLAAEKRRLSNDRSLIFDFSLRVAALPDHPIYSLSSFASRAAYHVFLQRELAEVAMRTSTLSADDHESIMNLAKNVLLARRQARYVGKIHIEVLGVGADAMAALESEFGLSASEDYPWEDASDVIYVNAPASEIVFQLVNVDGVSLAYLETRGPHSDSSSHAEQHKPLQDLMGAIRLPMEQLARQRQGLLLTSVKLEGWNEPVVIRVVFKWKKDNFYSITDHYSIYQYFARKAMDYDISVGNTGPTFPSASVAELLERYGQRYGVRSVFRILTDFEIQTEKLVETGQLEMPTVLASSERLGRQIHNEGANLNTVERNLLARSLESLRHHTISRLEKYRECFPTTSGISTCKTAISLLKNVVYLQQILDGVQHTSGTFEDILRDCIRNNGTYMLHMLEGLTEEPRTFGKPDTLKTMAEFILPELVADDRFYTDAFPVPVLPIACTVLFQGVTQLTESFLPEFEFDYNHAIVWFRGFKALKWLNDRYASQLDREVVHPFPLDTWYKPSMVKWLELLAGFVHTYTSASSLETWNVASTIGRLHSDLLTDLFMWLEKVLSFLHYFEWAKPETCGAILTSYSETVSREVALLGVRMIQYLAKYKSPEDEKGVAWKQPWLNFRSFPVGSARDKEERKLAAGMVDRKICVLLNNIGLAVKWIERLQGASMALLDVQLKKTDPELRTNYLPSDYPIEQLYRDCELSLTEVAAQITQRIMQPLRVRVARDIVDIINSVQKLRQSMMSLPGAKGSKSDIVDVETELYSGLEGLTTHVTIFLDATSLVLYDHLFAMMLSAVFKMIVDEFSTIVYTDSFAAGVRADPLQGTYVARSVEMIRLYFLEGDVHVPAATLDQAAAELLAHLKNSKSSTSAATASSTTTANAAASTS